MILTHADVMAVDELWLSAEGTRPHSPVERSGRPTGVGDSRTEKEIIEQALADTRGRVSGPFGAAAKLGVPSSSLATRIRTLKINKHQFKFRRS